MDDNWKGRAGDIFDQSPLCGNPYIPFQMGLRKRLCFLGFHIGHPLLQIAASGQELLKHVK